MVIPCVLKLIDCILILVILLMCYYYKHNYNLNLFNFLLLSATVLLTFDQTIV